MPATAEEEEPSSPPRPDLARTESEQIAAAIQQSLEMNGTTGDADEITPAPRVNGNQVPDFNQEPLQPTVAPSSPSAVEVCSLHNVLVSNELM